MTTTELYSKGARVWIPHSTLVWEPAEVVLDFSTKTLHVEFPDGRKKELKIDKDRDLPPLRNPEILLGENDLTALSYLHEPAVLHNLKYRFCNLSTIYTYCGIVLVAINPYEELHIYDNDTIWTYRGKSQGELVPHIFAVAEEAYTRIERESRDQSIIVSGESGAGKTVSAKYVMRYFATVGGSSQETQVEKKVLSSSPIMEAFGNAKTTRNDNSSRFGKFIEIKFNKSFHIVGASMRTYLLEKSRVVFQAPGERNYHIFYQICAARDKLPHLLLTHPNEFSFLNQGDSPFVDGVDDLIAFEETVQALNTLGFTKNDQDCMFRILAGILHLGNVNIERDGEGSIIRKKNTSLNTISNLLELNDSELRHWLCNRQIISNRDVVNKPMTAVQVIFLNICPHQFLLNEFLFHNYSDKTLKNCEAIAAREALSKHMYSTLFNWIVSVINNALINASERSERFIGVLDIYGFETFEVNSFEQFCINYANEKLQQQFNQHVFKLEQEEYLKEGIEWKLIDFYDNQPCIDLIESKLGILDLLDEECRMPNGSDNSWVEKLYKTCGTKYKHFAKPRFGTTSFVIHHFADNVEYQAEGFLDKNRDSVIEEQILVLRNSKIDFVRKLFSDDEPTVSSSGRVKIVPFSRTASHTVTNKAQNKRTVGSQFRDSLNLLMTTLNATTPHYVRCIKPNDTKTPFDYNPQRAVQQLRACGVLETIRISAAGFPSRWAYTDFLLRYRVLCLYKEIHHDIKVTCQKILNRHIKDTDKYQFGKTKIFFRAGQVAFLEKIRADKLKQCCIIIQKNIRAFIARSKYLAILKSTELLQRYSRGLLARRRALFLRQTKAAIVIQRYMRGWIKSCQYRKLKHNILGIQTKIRGLLARKKYLQMRYNHSAIVIQRHVKGWLARREYARKRHQVIICQSAIRRFLARRLLRKLRKEARSVEHVKKLNKGLENKIISLQQKIEELTKSITHFKTIELEVNDLRTKVGDLKAVEVDNRKLEAIIAERNEEIKILREKILKDEEEKMDLISEKMNSLETIRILEEKNNMLQKQLDRLNEQLTNSQIVSSNNLKVRLDQERNIMMEEHQAQLENYQKLVADYANLEERNEYLEKQMEKYTGSQHFRPGSINTLSSHTDGENETDLGYGSHNSSSHRNKQNAENEGNLDIGLVLQLQQKLKHVEKERDMLFERIENLEHEESPNEEKKRLTDNLKMEQLEIENDKLKRNLQVLRDSLATGDRGTKELLNQFKESEYELERKRNEIIQLRAVLASQTKGLQNIAKINYGSSTDINLDVINEDGELVTAFEAQKRINKQLENELQEEKNRRKTEEDELRVEISRLKEDNDRQQIILSGNLNNKSDKTQGEVYMQHEISRLTTENLDLQEKIDSTQEILRKMKKQNKILNRRLRELGADNENVDPDGDIKNTDKQSNSAVKGKERTYEGMIEYRREDETIIIKHLITDLRPKEATTLLPCLPAYIFFMCIRHTDYLNDDQKVRSLLNNLLNAVKKLIKRRQNELEYGVLWLSNTVRLLHNLKQYSGDKIFQNDNTLKQNEQCLRNFDLVQYRQVLSDLAVWIYQGVIREIEEKIQNEIVPAILENELIPGLPHGPMRHRSASLSADSSAEANPSKHLEILISQLSKFHRILVVFGVDNKIIGQIFRQTFYFICASSLNNLLLRKDLCHWTRGMQIRYNISNLEQWTRDENLHDPLIIKALEPIIQASQLLQARKTDSDVQLLCDMCDQLPMQRIIKLLHLYTPTDDSERLQSSFMKNIQLELQNRRKDSSSLNLSDQQGTLMMDTKFVYPVTFSFNPSKIRLEDIEIPDCLKLPMLKKV